MNALECQASLSWTDLITFTVNPQKFVSSGLIGRDHSVTIWLWGHIYIFSPFTKLTITNTTRAHKHLLYRKMFFSSCFNSIMKTNNEKIFYKWKLIEIQRLCFGHEWKTRRQLNSDKLSFNFAWTYSDFADFSFSEKLLSFFSLPHEVEISSFSSPTLRSASLLFAQIFFIASL